MNMRKKLPYILILSAGILFAGSHYFLHAQSASTTLKDLEGPYANHPEIQDLNTKISDKNQQLQQLKDDAKAYKDRLDSAQGQSKTIASQMQFFDNQITKLQLDIRASQLEIDKSKLQIASLEFQIGKEQDESDAQKNKLREYIKLINKEDQRNYLEILLMNNSFAEFFNQIRYIEDIQSDVKKTIDRLVLLHDSLSAQKADIENTQADTEKLKAQMEKQQDNLKDQYAVKENLLLENKKNEFKYQRQISEAQSIESEISSSITSIKDEIKKKLERLKSGATDAKTTLLMWPVSPSRGISTYFHDPDYPFRYIFEHDAVDIRASQGTPIKAPADGYVVRARDNGYGYSYITLVHDNSMTTLYGHVSRIFVTQDQFVKAGEVIGLSGATPGTRGAGPYTTGPHLHFEVRLNGIAVDPLKYLP